MTDILPRAFADLQDLVPEWAIDSADARYRKRVGSAMSALQALHDRVFPRAEAIVAYLDKLPIGGPLSEADRNLLNLMYALITVAPAVQIWKQPRVPATGELTMTRLD